jgi:hypothetical protein
VVAPISRSRRTCSKSDNGGEGIEPLFGQTTYRQHRSHSSDLILRQYIRINAGRKGQQNFYEVERYEVERIQIKLQKTNRY